MTACALAILLASALAGDEVAPPLVPALPPTPQTPRVHVRLNAVPKDTELYDVSTLSTLCRAPCGVWLATDDQHLYQLHAEGFRDSRQFDLAELEPGVSVDIDFVPRDEVLYRWGLGLTIAGAVGVGGGFVATVIWLVVVMIANIFLGFFNLLFNSSVWWIGGFEVLYGAAIAAAVGAPFLPIGIPLLVKARERLDLEARPFSESLKGR